MSKELRKHLKDALDYISVLEESINTAGNVVSDIVYDNLEDTDLNYREARKILNKED